MTRQKIKAGPGAGSPGAAIPADDAELSNAPPGNQPDQSQSAKVDPRKGPLMAFMVQLASDLSRLSDFVADPAGVAEKAGLSEADREILFSGDQGRIYLGISNPPTPAPAAASSNAAAQAPSPAVQQPPALVAAPQPAAYGQAAYGQTVYQQAPYGQPAYPSPAYPQPAYSQAAYAPQAYPQAPYPAYSQSVYAQVPPSWVMAGQLQYQTQPQYSASGWQIGPSYSPYGAAPPPAPYYPVWIPPHTLPPK